MHILGEHVANLYEMFNPIQDGGAKSPPPTSFSPFATLVQNFKFAPSASPKLLNLNQDLKKSNFSGQILIKLRL